MLSTWDISMNKKSILHRMQLPIDVTALLDVVFIVLLIVICHQQQIADDRSQTMAAMEQEAAEQLQEAENARVLYEERLSAHDSLTDLVGFLSVSVSYTPGNPSRRTICLLDDSKEAEVLTIDINRDNAQAGFADFNDTMVSFLDAAEGKPVILTVDLDRILYRDEEAIQGILADLKDSYDNLYIR